MFRQKPHADIKKSSQKVVDPKKDSPTRLKHLKIYLDNVDISEAKHFFESNFSHIYFIFYDLFLSFEASVKQKAQKSHREELDNLLVLFERILSLLPELVQKKWQCHSIGRVMKKLLHPSNSWKVRREGMRLFLIWYQILGENAPEELHVLFVNLVPDLPVLSTNPSAFNPQLVKPPGSAYGPQSIREGIDNLSYSSFGSDNSSLSNYGNSSHIEIESGPVLSNDNDCLIPTQLGEKPFEDPTAYYFETLMEFIVSQMIRIEWKDKSFYRQQQSFQFIFNKFKKYYLPIIFPNFDVDTSLYKPVLDLPKVRKLESLFSQDLVDSSSLKPNSPHSVHPHHPQFHQHQMVLHERLLQCRVIAIRWVANYIHSIKKIPPHDVHGTASKRGEITTDGVRPVSSLSDQSMHNQQDHSRSESLSSGTGVGTQSVSSVSTLSASSFVGKEAAVSMQSIEDHSYTEYMIIRDTLYTNRENVNFVHEVFRQAFLLPFNHSRAIRRVIECYRDWIHMNLPELPAFMLEPLDGKESFQNKQIPGDSSAAESSASERGSISSGSQDVIPKAWRHKSESYLGGPHHDHNIRAGLQNLLQTFITSASNVFLLRIEEDQPHFLLDEQVEMCKKVLNIYRFMVMNVRMEQRTWEQLLLVLLQITSLVLKVTPPSKKDHSLGGRLAPALFQTLIVTWIKANLNVPISSNLWDRFLQVLSSLTRWEELIREWAKTMETLTRVLAKQVYSLDLNDLPLERLSEQKQKKRRGRMNPTSASEERSNHTIKVESTRRVSSSNGNFTFYQDIHGQLHDFHHSSVFYCTKSENAHSALESSFSFNRSSLTEKSDQSVHGLTRSSSDGNLTLKKGRKISHSSNRESSIPPDQDTCHIEGISPALEQEVEKIISNAEEYVRENNFSLNRERPFLVKRRSRSADSLSNFKGSCTPPSSMYFCTSETPNRSPSPAPSTGVDSNSFKDSPMHLDTFGNSDNSCSNSEVGMEQCSVMAGGTVRGWLPDVAVMLWRRMLCALGNINKIELPEMHWQIMKYLTDLFETMIKLRNNLGVTSDNLSTPPSPEFIPPITLIVPWLFQALNLDDTFKLGKLYAYRLLCTVTVRRHDVDLPRNYIAEFYKFLHRGLVGNDQDIINTIVKHCGSSFFQVGLPGSTLMILDFIYAANTIASSSEITDFPRTEALTVLGSLLCIPKHYSDIPVLQPNMTEPKVMQCNDIMEHLVSILIKSGKREPTGLARCIAINSLGLYIYQELAHKTFHPRIKDALMILLTALKFNNRAIAQVASDMLLCIKDQVSIILEQFPDISVKIIEELSSTLLYLLPAGDTLPCNDDRKLIVSLMFCLGEWVMSMPLSILLDPKYNILQNVFKVLNTAAVGSEAKEKKYTTVTTTDSSTHDFDLYIKLDNLREAASTFDSNNQSGKRDQNVMFSSNSVNFETKSESRLVRLAARTVIYHLISHLNHFPHGIGASRLNSMVNENDDLSPNDQFSDEFSTNIFDSSQVQLFILNNDMLISLVETPIVESFNGANGLKISKSKVRLIVRALGGKFTWDSLLLHGIDDPEDQGEVNSNLSSAQTTAEYENASYFPPSREIKHRSPNIMPLAENSSEDFDNLDDLLQYIGHTSSECLLSPGCDLNIPSSSPCNMSTAIEDQTINTILDQCNDEVEYLTEVKNDSSMKAKPASRLKNSSNMTPFHHCRMLLMELGLMSWEKRSQFDLLKKNEKLLRELKNLDNQNCRESHKIAVIYVAEGQEDKSSVLKNCAGSQAYEDFVAGLGWEVELETHPGFMGGLQRNRSTGDTAPYFATSFVEVMFHVSTRMPSNDEDSLTRKLRHLGNDEIHIVWSEHTRDYRRGIIATEFCDVLIVIYPLPSNLYRIQISRKSEVPFFGPLFDGAIVDHLTLPGLVRATAINASKAKRSLIPLFQNFYEERARSLDTIKRNHKDPKTFEEFTSLLYDPGQSKSTYNSHSVRCFDSSNISSASIDASPRTTPPVNLRQRPMSMSSAVEKMSHMAGNVSPSTARSASYNVPSS